MNFYNNSKIIFLITEYVSENFIKKLESHGIICDLRNKISQNEILKIIENYDGLIVRSKTKIDRILLDKAKKLKCIGRLGSGMENIDVEYAEHLNIKCFNSPEGNKNAVAEHAIGLLLNLLNNINKAHNEVLKGLWLREENRGTELKGKTVGIIGYGNTGSEFAKKLYSFDCKIIAYDKYKKNFGNNFVYEVDLTTLQQEADIISFHVPLTKETHYYLNYDFINQCKKPFYLINTSRGPVVNTNDLIKALNEKKILGAALDVIEFEDYSFEKTIFTDTFKQLLQKPNVIVTPHIAGWTKESKILLEEVLAEKILNFITDACRK
jgi:D-3-phosphoglycerate dehydrogenase